MGVPTWIRGERQLLDTTGKKIWLSRVLALSFKHLNPFDLVVALYLLVC